MDDMFPQKQPVVTVRNGEVFANSRDVAEFFGKQHLHVLRDIDNLLKAEPDLGLSNFGLTPYVEPQNGQTYRSYDMTRDGFSLLAMGFTGAKALKWKLRYIEAFNAMEAGLRVAVPDFSDPVFLIGLLTEHTTKRIEAERRADKAEEVVAQAKPKVDAFDAFMNSEGLYGLQNAARVLGEPPNKFIGKLKQKYLFYQGGSLVPRAPYKAQGIFEVKCTTVDDKSRYQTFVTPKGIAYFSNNSRAN